MAVCPRWMFLHGPVKLLSETNYAGCQDSSLSNGLCCCGSLEGRSFILFSTPICPGASGPRLLCLPLWVCYGCVSSRGCVGEREIESVSLLACSNLRMRWLPDLIYARLCGSMCLCLYTCRHRCMCCFHNEDCVCAPHTSGSWLIDHATHYFLSTLSANHNTPCLIS